jgi:NAD(P)H-dependent flavin oxidoreductase YrpB (nitropropane dioxygenase family)
MKSFFIGNKEVKRLIIQDGMGIGFSLSGLASAVANEGETGVISCARAGLLYSLAGISAQTFYPTFSSISITN